MEKPKKVKAISKWGKAFLIFCILNFIGLVIVFFVFPDFIGDNERTIIEYIPFKFVVILWILLAIFIGIGQTKKPPFFEPVWFSNSRIMKIFTSILAVVGFPFLFASSSVLVVYSLINYSFINEEAVLEGKLYKKEVIESRGHRGGRYENYYIYFNEEKKYSMKVSESLFNDLKDEDIIELNVLKGRLNGYYVTTVFNTKEF